MTHDIVNGNASWESDSSLELLGFLVVEYLSQFLFDELIYFLGNSVDVGTWNSQLDGFLQSVIGNLGGGLILIKDCWLLNEGLVLVFFFSTFYSFSTFHI